MAYLKAQEITHFELFNVAEDPTETTNLATKFPDKVKEMEQQFLQWKSEVTSGPT